MSKSSQWTKLPLMTTSAQSTQSLMCVGINYFADICLNIRSELSQQLENIDINELLQVNRRRWRQTIHVFIVREKKKSQQTSSPAKGNLTLFVCSHRLHPFPPQRKEEARGGSFSPQERSDGAENHENVRWSSLSNAGFCSVKLFYRPQMLAN